MRCGVGQGLLGRPSRRVMRAAVSVLMLRHFIARERGKQGGHIIIPEIKMAFTTYNYYHHYSADG